MQWQIQTSRKGGARSSRPWDKGGRHLEKFFFQLFGPQFGLKITPVGWAWGGGGGWGARTRWAPPPPRSATGMLALKLGSNMNVFSAGFVLKSWGSLYDGSTTHAWRNEGSPTIWAVISGISYSRQGIWFEINLLILFTPYTRWSGGKAGS